MPDKRARMLVDFRPRLVVVFPDTAHLLPSTTAPLAAVGPVEEVGLRLDELAGRQDPTPTVSRARPDDFAVLLSSGGTTGVSKGSVRNFTPYTPPLDDPFTGWIERLAQPQRKPPAPRRSSDTSWRRVLRMTRPELVQ